VKKREIKTHIYKKQHKDILMINNDNEDNDNNNNNNNNNNSFIFIYLYTSLTAQRPSIKLAQVKKK
jgi:hypothetical protein